MPGFSHDESSLEIAFVAEVPSTGFAVYRLEDESRCKVASTSLCPVHLIKRVIDDWWKAICDTATIPLL